MKVYLISDTHFNHANIATYCDRPPNFTEIIIKRWREVVKPDDMVIHLGDVFIGKPEGWDAIHPQLTGHKTLIRGNHDDKRSPTWWLAHGFESVNDGMVFRRCWLTHHPAEKLPPGCTLNIHGHLHNIWHGFAPNAGDEKNATELGRLHNEWQRLFAVEYTDYRPVEFDKFVAQPDKYQSRGKK
jgi:calcineurin-like phosphoesterase family protein